MIRALLQRILGNGRAQGGRVGATTHYQPAGPIHHGEYTYRAEDGTVWHVEQHPDGDIRTRITPADLLEGDDE